MYIFHRFAVTVIKNGTLKSIKDAFLELIKNEISSEEIVYAEIGKNGNIRILVRENYSSTMLRNKR